MIKRIDSVDVAATLETTRNLLREEKQIPGALRAAIEALLHLVTLLCNRLGLDSSNSSKPPSSDPNRPRKERQKSDRKPGGQPGHVGKRLEMIDSPDEVRSLMVDRTSLPAGSYRQVGVERRQVVDIDFVRTVTEYQAEVLQDAKGNRFVAPFPDGVTQSVQYGAGVKSLAVYLSQYQLLPYGRVAECFADRFGIPVSQGSLCNFNQEAFQRLEPFEIAAKQALSSGDLLHADETSLNIDGKKHWLHLASNDKWVCFHVSAFRGRTAMEEMGILASFRGVLSHDHWKPYFTFPDLLHALCNAHHLRELARAFEQDQQKWAEEMSRLLLDIKDAVDVAGGLLAPAACEEWRNRYRDVLNKGETECPPPDPEKKEKKKGRQKRSKARNLLERLREHEDDTLRFMEVAHVPFTNNQGENDLRMSKVQQKISGCFRSIEGARSFCRIRGFLLSCQRRGIPASLALGKLFKNMAPLDILADKAE